ncbi:hypothetical protein H7J93_25665 [Mycobacterium barrassiae]|uniref:hypothetical protein n=1 Tax=Mycobacterium barrassiae TaxID=319709 RepID=UPI002265C02F|nr:hypothetical protein [Mycobacterium barrassiae]MCV7303017.1 hypothetical protein [Mycobacterium barrassiae]
MTNLRAALDHATYAHVSARHVLTEAEEQSLQYPILEDRSKWTKTTRALTPLMDPSSLRLVEASQPFQDEVPSDNPLAWLNELVNRDKHRSVRLVTYLSDNLEVVTSSEVQVVKIDVTPTRVVDGAVAAVVTIRRPILGPGERNMAPRRFNAIHSTSEYIELPTPGDQRPLVLVLAECIASVDAVLSVFQQLEDEIASDEATE